MKKILLASFTAFFLIVLYPLSASTRVEDDVLQLRQAQENTNRVLAETKQSVDLLRQEVQSLRGLIEESKHFYEEEADKNARILRDSDLRLTGMEERLAVYETQLQDILNRGTTGKTAVGEEALYRRALSEINIQNFKGAITQLNEFMQKFPKSTLADNAQYWKGEALYSLKQYPEAILEFQNVIKKYPKSEKIAGVILKQGYCFFETKAYLDAKVFLQKVITNFPKSEESNLAVDKMRVIDRALAAGPTAPTTQPSSTLPQAPQTRPQP